MDLNEGFVLSVLEVQSNILPQKANTIPLLFPFRIPRPQF